MANEPKDQRVVTMMAASELSSIDDWSFENRIRSRGEAIRRLCQIGLATDEQIIEIHEEFFKLEEHIIERLQALRPELDTPQARAAFDEVQKIGLLLLRLDDILRPLFVADMQFSLGGVDIDVARARYAEVVNEVRTANSRGGGDES